MNLGILGGAFDPPHNAHLMIAEAARQQLGLDRVRFIPYAAGPHRPEGAVADAADRFEMVVRCIADLEVFEADDREIAQGGTSWTVDTLEAIAAEIPGGRLTLILGTDQLRLFTTWRSWERILELAELAALRRGDEVTDDLEPVVAARVRAIDLPPMEVSSTLVRAALAAGEDIRHLVPPAVARYIEEHRLYT